MAGTVATRNGSNGAGRSTIHGAGHGLTPRAPACCGLRPALRAFVSLRRHSESVSTRDARLTTLTPDRVALRVPMRHGLVCASSESMARLASSAPAPPSRLGFVKKHGPGR
jgi:hypothetical protein